MMLVAVLETQPRSSIQALAVHKKMFKSFLNYAGVTTAKAAYDASFVNKNSHMLIKLQLNINKNK